MMSDDICEVSRIVKKAENEAHLRRTQSEALNRIYKLELVLKILKALDVNQLDVADKQRLRNSLKVLGIQDCISLLNSDRLLGNKTKPQSICIISNQCYSQDSITPNQSRSRTQNEKPSEKLCSIPFAMFALQLLTMRTVCRKIFLKFSTQKLNTVIS